MHPQASVDLALRWVRWGLNDCEIARLTGINRRTILDWRHAARRGHATGRPPRVGRTGRPCPICERRGAVDSRRYAYLLGMYLGDGTISEQPRTFRRRIVLDMRYPKIIAECDDAMANVLSSHKLRVGHTNKIGCIEVGASWKHWPCLFPQSAPGPKHLRRIELASWQRRITSQFPHVLLRGLIHSDGCRDLNYVKGKSYPRYSFSNVSTDILAIFCRACEDIGVHWTRPSYKSISIARRRDVELLDFIIGPNA
jgi:Homeodomain-like domain